MSGIVKPPFGTPLNRDHWAAQGLVASYLFNENSGRTVYDSSGNENHGTMTGFGSEDTVTSGWTAGPHGGAVGFDGADDFIAFGTNLRIAGNVEMTMITGFSSRSIITQQSIVVFGSLKFYSGFGLHLNNAVQGCLSAEYQGNKSFKSHANAYVANQFCHAAVTKTPGTINLTTKLYLDGKIIPISYADTGTPNTSISFFDAGIWNHSILYFSGYISYIHVWNRALSPEEISYLAFDPYAAYRWDDSIFPNTVPAKMDHYRRCIA